MIPVVNLAELDQQTFGDAELKREVLALFAEQAPVLLQALAASSGKLRAETAHRLKGSALAIGAGPLAEQASALEQSPDTPAFLSAVEEAMAEVLAVIPHL
jgi:HPt (histidine-containing phosphotransfer) domain-containing protein